MTSRERTPTPDELLAMAYVDGELDDEAARAFEDRLPDEPALVREVAELRERLAASEQKGAQLASAHAGEMHAL